MFVTVNGTLLATFTVSTIVAQIAAPATAASRVHVAVPSVHVHPAPLIAVAVTAGGSVSTSVTVPLVARSSMFLTELVYDFPASPCVKRPMCVFVIVRS